MLSIITDAFQPGASRRACLSQRPKDLQGGNRDDLRRRGQSKTVHRKGVSFYDSISAWSTLYLGTQAVGRGSREHLHYVNHYKH